MNRIFHRWELPVCLFDNRGYFHGVKRPVSLEIDIFFVLKDENRSKMFIILPLNLSLNIDNIVKCNRLV